MADALALKEVLAAVDLRARDLWDSLDEDQQKKLKGEMFTLNRFVSNVNNQPREIQEYFVLAVNEYFNKHWASLQSHPKLMWNLLCLCGHENQKIYFHKWLGLKGRKAATSKKAKFLASIYPNHKIDEIELMCQLLSDDQVKELAKDHGYQDSDVDKLL